MRRIGIVLGVAAVMAVTVVLAAGTVLAQAAPQGTLDANTLGLGESVNAYTAFPGQKQVQTFTAEHDGQLTTAQVKIHLDSGFGPIDGLKMDITTVDPATGLPTSNVLASTTIPSSDIPLLPVNTAPGLIPLTTLTFENPATVTAGERYAIVIDTIASGTSLHFLRWTTILQEYSGGQGMWINDNGSFAGFLPAAGRGNVSDQVFAIYLRDDDIAPTTTASATVNSGTPYEPGTWTNEDVKVSLSALDNEGGSGVKEIRYSATGAQGIPETAYDPQNPPLINAEGTTTVSYFATDNAGNQETPSKTFTVKLDNSPPKVGTTTPASGATGVSRNSNPTATFSEKMDPASVTKATFKLYKCPSATSTNCTTQVTNVTVALSADDLKATLNRYGRSSTLLAKNSKYKAVVTTGAKDAAGNALDQDPSATGNQQKVWYFTTGRR